MLQKPGHHCIQYWGALPLPFEMKRMNMKRFYGMLLSLLIMSIIPLGGVRAEEAASAIQRIGKEVAELNLGFGDYALGRPLNEKQKELAKQNSIPKTVAGTVKFKDDNIFVIAQSDNFMVLGMYKMYDKASRQQVKTIVGDLMLRFNEPTTMAHDKLIYWAFNKNGRITQDDFDNAKQSGDTDIVATVKLSSTSAILPDPSKGEMHQANPEQDETADMYVMITSNPLSKIFLAQDQ